MKRYSRAYVEITNICNRSCSFCPGTSREPRMMSVGEFEKIAKKVREVTDYVYLHIMGEPLLHPDITEIISAAAECGLRCAITTNGTLLPELTDSLTASPLYKINISLHSSEGADLAEHERYVRDCARAADELSSHGILTVLRLWNVGHDEGRNDSTVGLLREHFHDCEWVSGSRGVRIRDKLHIEFADRFTWPDMKEESEEDEIFCYGLKDHFGILCDGRVVPCCLDREGAVTLGNIHETPLSDILSSERACAIREGFSQRRAVEELCRRCPYARRFK